MRAAVSELAPNLALTDFRTQEAQIEQLSATEAIFAKIPAREQLLVSEADVRIGDHDRGLTFARTLVWAADGARLTRQVLRTEAYFRTLVHRAAQALGATPLKQTPPSLRKATWSRAGRTRSSRPSPT